MACVQSARDGKNSTDQKHNGAEALPILMTQGEVRGGMTQVQERALVEALQDPRLYDHPVQRFSVVETHISWVLLTGLYAYKIKKPVDFRFADFSTLKRRQFYCQEELRLNRRLAPDLYLAVLKITGSAESPRWGGEGDAVEYAVKMREFSQEALLSEVAARRALAVHHIDELVAVLAAFHVQLPPADSATPFGSPDQVHHWARENFTHIWPWMREPDAIRDLERLRDWTEQEFAYRRQQFKSRKDQGFIRECHGDLHLGNMALFDGRIRLFDCIEFNEHLRWIDVISEAAFVIMDLRDRGYPTLSCRFLNRYLQSTGDYAGAGVLRYYLVYRALVRAKVAVLRLAQGGLTRRQVADIWQEHHGYVKLALGFSQDKRAALIITYGVSGSGKSTVAAALAESLGAIVVRSDVERKRLYGFRPTADTHSALQGGIYSAEATRLTYERLCLSAASAVDSGWPVIVDATFLRRSERDRLRQLAIGLRLPFCILDCTACEGMLQERVSRRAQEGERISEAGPAVLAEQLRTQDPLSDDEMGVCISVDTSRQLAPAALAQTIGERLLGWAH